MLQSQEKQEKKQEHGKLSHWTPKFQTARRARSVLNSNDKIKPFFVVAKFAKKKQIFKKVMNDQNDNLYIKVIDDMGEAPWSSGECQGLTI